MTHATDARKTQPRSRSVFTLTRAHSEARTGGRLLAAQGALHLLGLALDPRVKKLVVGLSVGGRVAHGRVKGGLGERHVKVERRQEPKEDESPPRG